MVGSSPTMERDQSLPRIYRIGEFGEGGEVVLGDDDVLYDRGCAETLLVLAALNPADVITQTHSHRDVVVLALGDMEKIIELVAVNALHSTGIGEDLGVRFVPAHIFRCHQIIKGLFQGFREM